MRTFITLFNQFPFIDALRFSLFKLVRHFTNSYAHISYSQTGEDVIIRNILGHIERGFYVEIGSNEPIQHSNTFDYYLTGWRGITVDANRKMVEQHKKLRPNDVSIWTAVSDAEEEVTFYEFDMDEISTINEDFYLKYKDKQQVTRQTTIKTRTLDSILDEYLPKNTVIDLLSIDVEGHDFHVLRSLNLKKYRPKLIIIEMHDFTLTNPSDNEIYRWMIENEYHLVGYAIWNGYFLANESSTQHKSGHVPE